MIMALIMSKQQQQPGSSMNHNEIILQSLDIIIEEKLWSNRKPSEILKILNYVSNKGWLYTTSIDNQVKTVICGYRIPEVTDENLVRLPIKEYGKILYIPFVISLNKEDNMYRVVREALNIFLKENQDLTEMVIEDKNNQIKRYKLGANNGEESTVRTSNATNAVC